MRGFNSRSLPMMLLSVAMGVSACKAKSTFVHVRLQPAAQGEPAPITDIDLQLDLGGRTTSVHLAEPDHAPISLPTDVTLQVKSGSGTLSLLAIAKNAAGAEVDRINSTVQVSSGAITESALVFPGGRPDLQPAEATKDYAATQQGSGAPANLSFVNIGFRPSGPLSVSVAGDPAWHVGAVDGCTGTSLNPGESCSVEIDFAPLTVGAITGTATVTADPGGSASVALTGTGLANPQNVDVVVQGDGQGTVSVLPSGASCTTNCTTAVDWNSDVTFTAAAAPGSIFVGWSGDCAGEGNCLLSGVVAARSVTAVFLTSLCGSSVTVGQAFSPGMQGCPQGGAAATFANRAAACGANAHVCSASEWTQQNGGLAPTHNYWTDDVLGFSSGSGTCGPGNACGAQNCFAAVSGTTDYTTACTAGQPMHVCAGTQPDPEGNTCSWTGCGFNSVAPKLALGGCANPGDAFAGSLCCSNSLLHQYVVDVGGNDANPGTAAAPFRTLTHALAVAVSADTVRVHTGTYSAGETFPLTVPAGVKLLGDEPNRGAASGSPTTIAGGVTLGAGSTLAGFTVNGQVALSAANVVVRNNTVTATGGFGIVVGGSTNYLVALNKVANNPSVGLYAGALATGKLENNTFTGNAYGIEFDAPGGDVGGGASGSVGNNTISCNANADFWTNQTGISMQNNKWDHAGPTTSCSTGCSLSTWAGTGVDVYSGADLTTVDTTGGTQSPTPCPACSASAVSSQGFDGIMIGCGGSVPFASRSTLCPSYCHVCSANEWNSHRGSITPLHNFYTNDLLGYSSLSGSNDCFSASGPSFCSAASQGPGGVCGAAQPDPEGNNCNNPNHALCPDRTSNQWIGGCNGIVNGAQVDRSGALCCCP